MRDILAPLVIQKTYYEANKQYADHCIDHFCEWLLDKFDVDKQTVMLASGSGFYSSPNVGLNQVRIAYVLNRRDLTKAIHILKLALEKYTDQ